jgi:polyhydroxyalkanoate synthesis regulator phasin
MGSTTLEMVMMKNGIPLQAFSIVIADRQHAVPPTLPLAQRKIIQMIKRAFCSLLLMGLCFTALRVSADDAALIDALVRKGILNQKEADSIEKEVNDEAAQASQQNANPLNSVLKIGSWIKELDLYGDLRLRNYYQNNQSQLPASSYAGSDVR